MDTTNITSNINGLTLRTKSGPPGGRTQPSASGDRLGCQARYPESVGAGQERAERSSADRPTGAFHFESLLTEHEAEAEYQGFLQEVEAEHLSRLEEEAASPLFAFLSRYAGEGVAA